MSDLTNKSTFTTAEDRLKLGVIIASTREGRFGDVVARWFADQARQSGLFAVDLIDLNDFDWPMNMPRGATPELAAFSARIDAADAFVIVTPEYNHGYPASLKLAIDSVFSEWMAKPVGFVSYGGISGGLRAVEQLRLVFAELHAATMRDGVSFHGVHRRFHQGQPVDAERVNATAATLMRQLTWWGEALRSARRASTYPRAG
jgi:NAD(P)H-dependent FMN reductase